MRTLEEEIEKIILTVAVEKPKPGYSDVYTGLYVFPAMTERFIRTCLVPDIVHAAKQHLCPETSRDAEPSMATGIPLAAPRDLPAGGVSGGT